VLLEISLRLHQFQAAVSNKIEAIFAGINTGSPSAYSTLTTLPIDRLRDFNMVAEKIMPALLPSFLITSFIT
jgi:hypothetical protein